MWASSESDMLWLAQCINVRRLASACGYDGWG